MSDSSKADVQDRVNRWLRLAPRPRPRPAGTRWDVFISYRSVNRAWALALYDSLREADFEVFLDQFVLPAGVEIEGFLRDNLKASASGVVIWSGDAATSGFVKGELAVMRELRRKREEFHYVLATLDGQELPFLEQNDLYVDFASYPEGPRGGELLKLMFGLVGQPLSDQAAREIHALNVETTDVVRRIKAAKAVGNPAALVQIAGEQSPVFVTTSLPWAVLAESLIEMGANAEALEVLARARAQFKESLRLKQLEGLALRRSGRSEDAQLILGQLHQDGHRDPETVGILGATWMQRYKKERKRVYLERSQSLYAEAFRLAPDSYYNGINAASKAALLGNLEEARALADQVLPKVSKHEDGTDYWATSTHAEVHLLLGNHDRAVKLYRAAVVAHLTEAGNIGSTKAQATDLLAALGVDPATTAKVLAAFSLD